MITVAIPTLLTKEQIQPRIEEIRKTFSGEIITSCIKQSASKNRNWCLDNATGGIIIMIDDDITGFYPDWTSDLISPLFKYPNLYSMVSIRCLNKEKNLGAMLGDPNTTIVGDYQKALHTERTGLSIVCSAGIAFIKDDIRFDEGYKAANYEDSDFCMQFNQKYPNKSIIINNTCKLIHLNEQKKIENNCNQYNKDYFNKKWNTNI